MGAEWKAGSNSEGLKPKNNFGKDARALALSQ